MDNQDELTAMTEVSRRLHEKFPNTPPETIDSMVLALHRQYDGRPIRDFIPVLVERDAAARLKSPAHGREPAPA